MYRVLARNYMRLRVNRVRRVSRLLVSMRPERITSYPNHAAAACPPRLGDHCRRSRSRALSTCSTASADDGCRGGTFEIPQVGLGMWQIPPASVEPLVLAALAMGYCHFDTACRYGNEQALGDALRSWRQRSSTDSGASQRCAPFVTSKLPPSHHAPRDVRASCRASRDRLGVPPDLYLVHFPTALDEHGALADIPLRDTWRALEREVDEGTVKAIGVSNFGGALLRDLLTYARHPPVAHQIELHPYNQQPEMVAFCQANGIVVAGYCPLGSPGYVSSGQNRQSRPELLLDLPLVKQLASKYQRTPAQILLRWSMQRGCVVLPCTTSHHRLRENISVFDFALDEEDMTLMVGLDRRHRYLYERHMVLAHGVPLYW